MQVQEYLPAGPRAIVQQPRSFCFALRAVGASLIVWGRPRLELRVSGFERFGLVIWVFGVRLLSRGVGLVFVALGSEMG